MTQSVPWTRMSRARCEALRRRAQTRETSWHAMAALSDGVLELLAALAREEGHADALVQECADLRAQVETLHHELRDARVSHAEPTE